MVRHRLKAAAVVFSLASLLVPLVHRSAAPAAPRGVAVAVFQPVAAEQPPPPPPPADPCWDHADLEAGRGSPVRQDWYNHLDARDYARAEMACAPWFWGGDQFDALDHIVMAESKWYTLADGPGECWGIPQACPGSKMASHGADWRTNNRVQTRWQLDYFAHGQPGKFHDPITAWRYRQAHGSY